MQAAFGGTVSWGQVPAYLVGEFVGGVLGGLAYLGIARSTAQAELTGLAPADSESANSAAQSGAAGAVKIGESLS
jgi:glycerol uptake facilitator-like aquaporin